MLKKFVPLTSATSPSTNPYEVRTYLGGMPMAPDWKVANCEHGDRRCDTHANSTISKVLTIEDELRRINEKVKSSRFQKPVKPKCDKDDFFTMCVLPKRTPQELRSHAVAREGYLTTQFALKTHVHDGGLDLRKGGPSLIQLNSPLQIANEGEEDEEEEEMMEEDAQPTVKPLLASPECSLELIYMPPKKLLELHRPKSGLFVNETDPPNVDESALPYSTYNPRDLQEKFDEQNLNKIDIVQGLTPYDFWTWNIGVQEQEHELEQKFIEASIPKLDCEKFELTAFKIPKDLDKTFTAEIVFGNETIPPTEIKAKKSFYNRPKEIACLFVAYVETFRFSPDFWTAETMDAILASAEKLLAKSNKLNYKSNNMDFDILPQIAERQATIGMKVHFNGPLENEPNIYKALSLYFSKFNVAVLCSKNLYLLIWKRCSNSFYVFDPNGRNEQCQRDFENGKCSIMATRYVEHLVHLVVNFSEADMHGDFNLYEIFVINYGKIHTPISGKPQAKLTHKLWAVVNNTYAVIPAANNGLHQPITGNEMNPSLFISMIALLYANIQRPKNWSVQEVDDVVKLGEDYYKLLRKKLKFKPKQPVNIIDMPDTIMMGAFRATLRKRPFLYTGPVADCKNFLDSQLTIAMKELFASRWESALLQIDNSVIAVWRDLDFFYLFDPFRRGKAGQVLDPEDYLAKGYAVLQMHTNFESFCRILYTKALKMRRGGKFFMHGASVGCIRPVQGAQPYKGRYSNLILSINKYLESEEGRESARSSKGRRDKKDKKKVGRKYSILSIPEEERITTYDEADVVDGVLTDIINEILIGLAEPALGRPPCYKQADKVLLRSDKAYLESLKYKLKHDEDFDNIYSAFQSLPDQPAPVITLEDELLIPSNYQILPDGSWVIFGTSQLPVVDDEISKQSGLLSGLVTAALTSKYKISTWNKELIEYALESVNNFGDPFTNYEATLSAVLSKQIPKIAIGDTKYRLKVIKIMKSAPSRSLRQVLLECLMQFNRLLVICQHFSCVIFKRYNFLYMFVGYSCNAVGYRKFGSGPGCMLRFIELDALIRRIEFGCNPKGCEITNYVVIALKVEDVTSEPPDRFKRWAPYQEDEMYRSEYAKWRQQQQNKMDKLVFLDRELQKENQRIQNFMDEKERILEARRAGKTKQPPNKLMISTKSQSEAQAKSRKVSMRRQHGGSEGDEEDFFDEEEFEEEEDEIALKHYPGKKLQREAADLYKPRPILYGYRMRESDCNYKIQGSIALEGRAESSVEHIKPCFFASTLAVLYAILRPLNEWTSQRVDRVIENAKIIAGRVTSMTTAFERIIESVTVDYYQFNVWVKTFEPTGVWSSTVQRRVTKALQERGYVLLQISNCTFAIYHDEYYHLFDPYGSMELLQDMEEEEEEEDDERKKKHKCPKGIVRYRERNTASWVLFIDVAAMLKYIDKRAANPEWQQSEEYKFHVVDVTSYKKATASKRILQLLTDLSVPMDCNTMQRNEDETAICAHNENLSWLELENCLPIWSRMNRRNSSGRYRNLSISKMKKYDIEIDGRLWSLWGNLHPQAPVFDSNSRGKQYLACNVMACCAARVYRLGDWSAQLLDSIVISGDRYHRESLASIKRNDYEFSLEDLNNECSLENLKFIVHLEHVAYGKLYCTPTYTRMNLAEGLMYFFGHFQFGILQCYKRSLAIGRTLGHDGGYFMYDCQSRDHPLFPKGQGSAYVLRTKHLQVLLYCIVVTLNIPYFNVQFSLHTVDMLRDGAEVEEDYQEEDEEVD